MTISDTGSHHDTSSTWDTDAWDHYAEACAEGDVAEGAIALTDIYSGRGDALGDDGVDFVLVYFHGEVKG